MSRYYFSKKQWAVPLVAKKTIIHYMALQVLNTSQEHAFGYSVRSTQENN